MNSDNLLDDQQVYNFLEFFFQTIFSLLTKNITHHREMSITC